MVAPLRIVRSGRYARPVTYGQDYESLLWHNLPQNIVIVQGGTFDLSQYVTTTALVAPVSIGPFVPANLPSQGVTTNLSTGVMSASPTATVQTYSPAIFQAVGNNGVVAFSPTVTLSVVAASVLGQSGGPLPQRIIRPPRVPPQPLSGDGAEVRFSIAIDEQYWWTNPARQYLVPKTAFYSDDDVWPTPFFPIMGGTGHSVPQIICSPLPRRIQAYELGQADDFILPVTGEDDYWIQIFSQRTSAQYSRPAFTSDEDVWPAQLTDWGVWYQVVETWSPPPQPIISEDDNLPGSLAVEDEYWFAQNQIVPLPPVQAFISDDDVWPASITVDEDYWWNNTQQQYIVPVQAFFEDDQVPPVQVNFDEDYWFNQIYVQPPLAPPAFIDDEILPGGPGYTLARPKIRGFRKPGEDDLAYVAEDVVPGEPKRRKPTEEEKPEPAPPPPPPTKDELLLQHLLELTQRNEQLQAGLRATQEQVQKLAQHLTLVESNKQAPQQNQADAPLSEEEQRILLLLLGGGSIE